ncbi:MAG: transcriptional regulator, partial [Flavobacterium sp. 38-13]
REMLGIKQDALAYELGDDWNQKKISLLEQKESVEKDILEQVAKILKVPSEAIENFDEDSVINIISNTFNEGSIANATAENIQCTFNPIDKIVVLYDEKIALYERMLKEKDDMMARLEKLIHEK